MNNPYDRERDIIEEEYNKGYITASEYQKELRNIDKMEFEDAQQAAEENYERTMIDRGF